VTPRDTFSLELADIDAELLDFDAGPAGTDLESVSGAQATAELATSCLYACSCCAICCCCCGFPKF
jgi:hypothetical protein